MEKKIFNEILGEIVYNEELEFFEGTLKWCGNDVGFLICADDSEESVINEIIATAEEIVKNQRKWDRIIKEYAAKELTELANDWADCEYDEETDKEKDPPEITEEEFLKRIDLCDISFERDGEFSFWFSDDDMFAGHSITVYGDIKNGCNSTGIEG